MKQRKSWEKNEQLKRDKKFIFKLTNLYIQLIYQTSKLRNIGDEIVEHLKSYSDKCTSMDNDLFGGCLINYASNLYMIEESRNEEVLSLLSQLLFSCSFFIYKSNKVFVKNMINEFKTF